MATLCIVGNGTLCAGALAETSVPGEIEARVLRDGAAVTVQALYANAQAWDAMRRHVASGDHRWIHIAETLYKPADGAAKETLAEALAEALDHSPTYLLRDATKGEIGIDVFCIGPDVDDERYGSYDAAAAALRKRVSSVQSVTNKSLEKYKTACINALSHAEKGLNDFFEHK